MRIVFLHLDLGIGRGRRFSGFQDPLSNMCCYCCPCAERNDTDDAAVLPTGGAEQLVVNLAVSALNSKHTVKIYTTHHDHTHCFAETKGDGEALLIAQLRSRHQSRLSFNHVSASSLRITAVLITQVYWPRLCRLRAIGCPGRSLVKALQYVQQCE